MVTASEGSPSLVTSSPLTSPHTAPTSDHQRDDRLDRPAGVPQRADQRAGQAEHRGDRQVDLGGHHQQGHRQRDERDLAEVAERERQVARAGEARAR